MDRCDIVSVGPTMKQLMKKYWAPTLKPEHKSCLRTHRSGNYMYMCHPGISQDDFVHFPVQMNSRTRKFYGFDAALGPCVIGDMVINRICLMKTLPIGHDVIKFVVQKIYVELITEDYFKYEV